MKRAARSCRNVSGNEIENADEVRRGHEAATQHQTQMKDMVELGQGVAGDS